MHETQISAFISESTKEQVEKYVAAHGVKKGHLIEQALLHHLLALKELPADLVIPARIVVNQATFRRLKKLLKNPPRPTKAMRDLMAGRPVKGEP